MMGTFYQMAIAGQRAYRFVVSPSCRTTAFKRMRSITRLVGGLTRALQGSAELAPIAETIRLHALLDRIQDEQSEPWGCYDDSLKESLSVTLPASISVADVKLVAGILVRNLGEHQQHVRVAFFCA
jgi:hypothetical protein